MSINIAKKTTLTDSSPYILIDIDNDNINDFHIAFLKSSFFFSFLITRKMSDIHSIVRQAY